VGSQRNHSPQYMKEGEGLLINGPYGDFYLPESERDIILFASEVRAEEHLGMILCL
jgi:NAD(P)H-flavin reductase